MRRDLLEQETLDTTLAETRRVRREFDNAHAWLVKAMENPVPPVCAEVWAFAPDLEHVLLVRHRWRGWVCPGGTVEHGESPRAAAVRELQEETGLHAEVSAAPVASWVRSYRTDWSPVLGLAYTAILGRDLPLGGEPGQPAAWFGLDRSWEGVFPEDRERLLDEACHLRAHFVDALPKTPGGKVQRYVPASGGAAGLTGTA